MAAKAKEKTYPLTITFGVGKVRIRKRTNGFFDLTWRELGATRKTTKTTEKTALEWAEEKAIELDSGSARRWVDQGAADSFAVLKRLAGDGEGNVRKLLEDVRGALAWLDGGKADLTTAARWYAENGPLKVERTTVGAAITRFLLEYERAPQATRNTFKTELDGFSKKYPDTMMLDLTQELLENWCGRATLDRGQAPAGKTRLNRITTWITFLNRARDWRMLSPGKHAAELIKRPSLPDAGKEILSVEQARALLAAVREHDPKLEAYLLIAGWLGLRPSEIQRLNWEAFEWERGYLHVSTRVAGKTSKERYIAGDERLFARLRSIFVSSEKRMDTRVCVFRSREFLSLLARREKILMVWPADVLRHSFCSYRLAVLQSLDRVAEEAGNSPAIIRSNYRRPLRADDGAKWWDLLNPTV